MENALSAALIVVTAVYAWLTWLIARRSGESAEASKAAAESSRLAAEAAQRSAVIAEATIALELRTNVDRHSDGDVWFSIQVSGANIWIHELWLDDGIVCIKEEGEVRQMPKARLQIPQVGPGPADFPVPLHQGTSGQSFEWPNPILRVTDWGCAGFLRVSYSLTRESDINTRTVSFALPHDFHDRYNRRTRLMPDMLRGASDDVEPGKPS